MGQKHGKDGSNKQEDPKRVMSGSESNKSDGLASTFSQSLVHINEENVEIGKFYYGLKSAPVGKGGTSLVRLVTHKETGKRYACKTIRLLRINAHKKLQLMREIDIIRKLDHPNVIKVIEVFKQWDQLHIVMEFCSGGELFDRLEAAPGSKFDEKTIHELVVKMVRALNYLHKNGIIHRDLKLENFIYTSKDPDADLKLIDFGYSRTYLEGEQMQSLVGTSFYIAPEVVEGKYGAEADLWSLGAIVYMLATGELPVPGDTDDQILHNVKQLKTRRKRFGVVANRVPGVNLSPECVDFINKLMEIDVTKRLTTEQCLQHPFILGTKLDGKESDHAADSQLDAEEVRGLVTKVTKFRHYPNLKRAALMATAFYMDDVGLNKLKAEFQAIDVNGDGVLSHDEFVQALSKYISGKELEDAFQAVDQDHTNKIKYSEFLAACIDEQAFSKQEQLMSAFRALDTDGDGQITKEELMNQLGKSVSEAEVDKLIADADFVKDGVIHFDEFARAMRGEKVDK